MAKNAGWIKPDFGSKSFPSSRHGKGLNPDGNLHQLASSSQLPGGKNATVEKAHHLLVVQHRPTSTNDLVVSKKKIGEVSQWLLKALSSPSQAPLLLVTGPPGCGKTLTLTLLCQEMNIDLHIWEEQIRYQSANEYEYLNRDDPRQFREERLIDMNPLDHLREFMMKTNRYSTLNVTGAPSVSLSKNKILLIKEFPSMVFTHLEDWHNFLTEYSRRGRTPAVFIVTEANANYGLSLKLFPSKLHERVALAEIKFNGLANSFISKALEKVLMKEKKSLPPNIQIVDIVESCSGDLRSAMNTMQLTLVGDRTLTKPIGIANKTRKRKMTTDVVKNSSLAFSARDGSLDFMHLLGKVLNAKRLDSAVNGDGLPPHLMGEARSPLKEQNNFDSLVAQLAGSPSKALLYLHQNFPPFFANIEDVARATNYLSTADMLSERCDAKGTLDECALLTTMRGLMHSNTSVPAGSWRPLAKPDFYSVQQRQRDFHSEARSLWPSQNDVQLFTERVPFMCKMLRQADATFHAQSQKRFLLPLRYSKSGFNLNGPPPLPVAPPSQRHSDNLPVKSSVEILPSGSNAQEEDDEIVIEDFDD